MHKNTCTCVQCGRPIPELLQQFGPSLLYPRCVDCWSVSEDAIGKTQIELDKLQREYAMAKAAVEDAHATLEEAYATLDDLEAQIADIEKRRGTRGLLCDAKPCAGKKQLELAIEGSHSRAPCKVGAVTAGERHGAPRQQPQ